MYNFIGRNNKTGHKVRIIARDYIYAAEALKRVQHTGSYSLQIHCSNCNRLVNVFHACNCDRS